jgi:hypothetical protein
MYTVIHDEVHNVQDDATSHVLLDRPNPQPTPNQPPRGESNLGDTSGPLFSLYSTAAEVADDKKVKSWQKDADGILIFVSPCVGIHISLCINWHTIDRFIFRRSCCAAYCDRPRPEAK